VRRSHLRRAVVVVVAALAGACSNPAPDDSSEPSALQADSAVVAAPSAPVASDIAPSTDTATASVRIVSQNILHGIACPPQTDRCALGERVASFLRQLEDGGCPEVVAIQEADAVVIAELEAHVGVCGYQVVWDGDDGVDREAVLTVLDVADSRRVPLAGGFRTALAVRALSDVGALDVITTHLSSSSDNGACDAAGCPDVCDPRRSVRECQARQVLDLVEQLDVGELVVVGGDLNATAEDPAYRLLVDGGLVDTHLAAGLAECAVAAPAGCTSGRDGTSMTDLTDPLSRQSARIDHLLVAPLPARCSLGEQSGPFHPEPLGGPIAYPSDHTAVALQLDCVARPAGAVVTFPTTTTTAVDGVTTDEAVERAVTIAFEGLFDGSQADVSARLAFLERGDELREAFLALAARAGDLAASTTVRVSSVEQTSPTTAGVVFDVLVDGGVVFEGRVGSALRDGGRWLVAAETFCDLATTFAPDAPGC
jgi:endonuclease/exonuclease/phosphatase family metal-dependent hydrolase